MPLPRNEQDLTNLGYIREETVTCLSHMCGQKIVFFRTPRGKRIPLDADTLQPHWETCPDADKFRGAKRMKKTRDGVYGGNRRH